MRHAYVEFRDRDVGDIVCEAVNATMLYGSLLICQIVSPETVVSTHPSIFKSINFKIAKLHSQLENAHLNMMKSLTIGNLEYINYCISHPNTNTNTNINHNNKHESKEKEESKEETKEDDETEIESESNKTKIKTKNRKTWLSKLNNNDSRYDIIYLPLSTSLCLSSLAPPIEIWTKVKLNRLMYDMI